MSPDLPVLSREVRFFDSYGHLWLTKLEECHPKFIASIRREGVREPVTLRFLDGEVYLADGHHRWAVAGMLGLLVPWADAAEKLVWSHRDLPWADGYAACDV